MRILVTGGTGFIGSHTIRALLSAGHDVKLLVRNEEKARRLWADEPRVLEDLVVGKLTSGPATADALRECDGLIHTAAPVTLGVSRAEARQAASDNRRSIRLLIDRALQDGMTRIVHLSTTALFDTRGVEIADEQTPIVQGGDPYALSKTAPELAVRALQERGAPIAITYPPSVIGPDDPGLSEGVKGIQLFLETSVILTTSGFQIVDVRDLAAIHLALIERDPVAPARYVTTARFMPWAEFAELLDQAAGVRLPRVRLPGKAMRFFGRLGDRLRPFMDLDPTMSAEATRLATQWVEFDGSRVTRELGIKYRDPRASLGDTIRWLAETGQVDPRKALRFTHPGRGRR
ncbi:MAG: NAD-dependent epimerase/dehydratase family protein [Spirochaetaceae bacterium]|nr:NAD-dependent epimerase/dehydratase family protein [Myxococcales bacterium]MCB9726288.1 NAD-dependent epimerase/dehydratase family protein [Spirochaetaceae bacterium]HPG28224.1 NAD-dependent epimerase/dehydratase family protein [Myxococcota bacterium]